MPSVSSTKQYLKQTYIGSRMGDSLSQCTLKNQCVLFFSCVVFIEWRMQLQVNTDSEIQMTQGLLPAPSMRHSEPLEKVPYYSECQISHH